MWSFELLYTRTLATYIALVRVCVYSTLREGVR